MCSVSNTLKNLRTAWRANPAQRERIARLGQALKRRPSLRLVKQAEQLLDLLKEPAGVHRDESPCGGSEEAWS